MSKYLRAHLALLMVNLIYGANFLIAKGIMPEYVSPNALVLIRIFGALILFWLVFFYKFQKIERKDLLRVVGCSIFGVVVNQLFFFNGLMLTSPVNSSIIMTFSPILVLVLSAFLLKERLSKQKLFGLTLGFVGAISLILLSQGVGASGRTSNLRGDIYIWINAISYSFYLITVKPLMSKYSPLTVVSWVFLSGLLISIPFGINDFIETDYRAMSLDAIYAILYVIIGTTFMTYLLNGYALSIVQPWVSSSFIYIQPLSLVFFTYIHSLIQPEKNYLQDITLPKILCGLLIIAGVYLISRPPKKKVTVS